jgi:hypothetical protein
MHGTILFSIIVPEQVSAIIPRHDGWRLLSV